MNLDQLKPAFGATAWTLSKPESVAELPRVAAVALKGVDQLFRVHPPPS
jgi:hypothetical protein